MPVMFPSRPIACAIIEKSGDGNRNIYSRRSGAAAPAASIGWDDVR